MIGGPHGESQATVVLAAAPHSPGSAYRGCRMPSLATLGPRDGSFERLEDESSTTASGTKPQMLLCSSVQSFAHAAVPCWLAVALAVWNVALTAPHAMAALRGLVNLVVASHDDVACHDAGAIVFDPTQRYFKGCDGAVWSQLAFCCAPDRPEPPWLLQEPLAGETERDCSLSLSWSTPAAHGSPVSMYTLREWRPPQASSEHGSGAAAAASEGTLLYSGPGLTCCVDHLVNHSAREPRWFTVTAHAVGGDSAPSSAVELQPAPRPVSLSAQDTGEGRCEMSEGDGLLIGFDRPTNRAGSSPANQVPPDEVERLLRFSAPVGPLQGRWRADDQLELRRIAGAGPSTDPWIQLLRVSMRPEGGVVVSPPAISLPSASTSPPVHVLNCFLEGFEAESVSSWFIESVDVSAYSVVVDESVVRSGRHSLRLEGGSSVNFDGLRAHLPASARPKHVSFWLRASAEGNVGYFTIGGSSIQVQAALRIPRHGPDP